MRPAIWLAAGWLARPRLLAAVGQLLLLDREDRALLHVDVSHDADASGLVGELGVVAAGLDAGDPQALVMVDGAVPVVLALVGPPALRPRRRQVKRSDRVQGEIPEPDAFAVLSRRGPAEKRQPRRKEQDAAHGGSPCLSVRRHSRRRRS